MAGNCSDARAIVILPLLPGLMSPISCNCNVSISSKRMLPITEMYCTYGTDMMFDKGSKNVLVKFMIMGSVSVQRFGQRHLEDFLYYFFLHYQLIASSLTPVPLCFSFNAWADSGRIPGLSYTSICHSFHPSRSTISWRYLNLMSTRVGVWTLFIHPSFLPSISPTCFSFVVPNDMWNVVKNEYVYKKSRPTVYVYLFSPIVCNQTLA